MYVSTALSTNDLHIKWKRHTKPGPHTLISRTVLAFQCSMQIYTKTHCQHKIMYVPFYMLYLYTINGIHA